MRVYLLLVWSTCMLLGAAVVRPLTQRVVILNALASYELVHVLAHLFLYGSLTALARHAQLSAARSALLALGVGSMQESVQLLFAGRGPGWPELFDLCVDGAAIAAVVIAGLVHRRFHRRPVLPSFASR